MKFLGSFIVLALLNLLTVFAAPPPERGYIRVDGFEYFIYPDGRAYIISVVDEKSTTLTIKPKITSEGKTYKVLGLYSGLYSDAVRKIILPQNTQRDFTISPGVLSGAKNLRELQIDARYPVNIDEYTFEGVSPDLQIYGNGVDTTVTAYAEKFMKENYPDLIRDRSNLDDYFKKCDLYQVAKIVRKYFTYDINSASKSNGASAIFLKRGDGVGLARVVSVLAAAANFDIRDVQVAGDDNQFGFNLVRFSNKWYVLDPARFSYNERDMCTDTIFKKSNDYIKQTINPFYGKGYRGSSDSFVVHHGKYGYPGELVQPVKENFKKFISRMNWGVLA